MVCCRDYLLSNYDTFLHITIYVHCISIENFKSIYRRMKFYIIPKTLEKYMFDFFRATNMKFRMQFFCYTLNKLVLKFLF